VALELRLVNSIEAVAPHEWDACAGGHPFVQHAFLKALETSGALGRQRGVVPYHALLRDSVHGLVACAPAMLKWSTLREHGPEIHWLRAGLEAGCFAWPKFQVGVPLFPVLGPKLLVRAGMPQAPLRAALLSGMHQLGQREHRESVFNLMHIDHATAGFCKARGALVSAEQHSMWTNPGLADLASYLATLDERKRYNFRKERRRAESHGLAFKVLRGRDLTETILADYYAGHSRVCERYRVRPWLPAKTYAALAAVLPESTMLMGYFDGLRFVAGSMKLHSQAEQTVYSLQWSEMTKLDGVALDLICQRPIDYALAHSVHKLDSGLAAPHKAQRGWQTTPVYNAHWFYNDPLKALALQQKKPRTTANPAI